MPSSRAWPRITRTNRRNRPAPGSAPEIMTIEGSGIEVARREWNGLHRVKTTKSERMARQRSMKRLLILTAVASAMFGGYSSAAMAQSAATSADDMRPLVATPMDIADGKRLADMVRALSRREWHQHHQGYPPSRRSAAGISLLVTCGPTNPAPAATRWMARPVSERRRAGQGCSLLREPRSRAVQRAVRSNSRQAGSGSGRQDRGGGCAGCHGKPASARSPACPAWSGWTRNTSSLPSRRTRAASARTTP